MLLICRYFVVWSCVEPILSTGNGGAGNYLGGNVAPGSYGPGIAGALIFKVTFLRKHPGVNNDDECCRTGHSFRTGRIPGSSWETWRYANPMSYHHSILNVPVLCFPLLICTLLCQTRQLQLLLAREDTQKVYQQVRICLDANSCDVFSCTNPN